MPAPPASPWASLSALGEAMHRGTVSALELTESALVRAQDQAALKAFITLHDSPARQRARELDATRRRPQGDDGETAAIEVSALHGIPLAIKDNIDEAGVVSSGGAAAYDDRVPARDAEVVTRLRRAGAVIMGRTNLHELADGVTSENPWYGSVVHPLRPGHHPGGSSGGSAAAVAAGCVPLALGTDTGGSVRIPAALCGLVGLKPTRGRIPTAGCMPLSTSLDHVGILGTMVADVAAAFRVLCDPVPSQARGIAPEERTRALRLGVLSGEAFGLVADAAVTALFDETLTRLRGDGHVTLPVTLAGLERGIALLSAIYPPEAAAYHRERLEARPEGFSEEVRRDLLRGLRPGAEEKRLVALEEAGALTERLAALMEAEGLDLLVSPTTPHPARPFGSPAPHTYLTYTCPFNLTGSPALTLPMGAVDGLPVGLQVVGQVGGDETLLGQAMEMTRQWR